MPSRRLSIALLVLSVWAVGLVAAGPAFSRGHLDPTFGEDGHIVVKKELPAGKGLGQVAPTAGGPIYFTQNTYVCQGDGQSCRYEEELRRFLPDGELDSTYTPGSDAFPGVEAEVTLIADANGLPVFGWTRNRQVQLRRLLPDGKPDPSFGDGGTVTLGCRCRLAGLEATPDGGLLVSAELLRGPGNGRGHRRLGFGFERLRVDGSLVPGLFPPEGVARVGDDDWYYPRAIPGSKGDVYVTGQLFRRNGGPDFFATRLTANGTVDTGFGRAVSAVLRKAYGGEYSVLWEGLGVFPRPRGVELLATDGDRTSILRIRADGHLDRSFGHRGEARLRLGAADAADAGGGRLFVEGSLGGRGRWYVQMLNPDGRRDRDFGSVYLPGAYDEYSVYIYPDGPGRAIVVSPGETVCRMECPSQPRIFRVLD